MVLPYPASDFCLLCSLLPSAFLPLSGVLLRRWIRQFGCLPRFALFPFGISSPFAGSEWFSALPAVEWSSHLGCSFVSVVCLLLCLTVFPKMQDPCFVSLTVPCCVWSALCAIGGLAWWCALRRLCISLQPVPRCYQVIESASALFCMPVSVFPVYSPCSEFGCLCNSIFHQTGYAHVSNVVSSVVGSPGLWSCPCVCLFIMQVLCSVTCSIVLCVPLAAPAAVASVLFWPGNQVLFSAYFCVYVSSCFIWSVASWCLICCLVSFHIFPHFLRKFFPKQKCYSSNSTPF